MTLFLALVLAAAGFYIAVKVVKFTVKALIVGGVAALLYLVIVPHMERFL